MESKLKHALITGASSGIGLELAKLFARSGHGLILVARERATLEHVGRELSRAHDIPVRVITKDLSHQGAADEIFDEISRASIHVDVLVNNAGFGIYSDFAESDLKTDLAMMQLNMVSLTHLTKLFLKKMLTRDEGKILNVASTAAFQPGPLMAVYYATKAYVLSFSEALAHELNDSGIAVSVLCPGPTASRFQQRAGMQGSRVFEWGVMDPGTVAAIGYRGLMKRTTVIVPGLVNRLLALSVRLAPRGLVPRLVRLILEKPAGESLA
ncbi:MAG: SDR family NAD(P)-dependent oxidoreductase [Gammaproteobacteria bacterium]|nr:SDR family NAD(P)-dependent oxidoreductase [Gammaproteobacteria bacterium]NIM73214.1 SDR family NAD(P)-dependent oxidoreductase [Gammaproteobacteria bacterium]NIN40050.1 SDR family NAD(P)-dependent oxidoreductase [Gammaproteobacteria bacterium]NIO26264.1 SDR family NAD(P)-dependent oxidoreductase [Gammaproteobacteria bacterium]NIO66073.1 SDR family NAD(P)-dependent oxidoreductase [Gammaproteobacteria bacterium]